MRKNNLLLLLAAITLVGCYNPPSESRSIFMVDNKTDFGIGMVSKAYPYNQLTLKVAPNKIDSTRLLLLTTSIGLGSFELCNLDDTSSLFVSTEEMKQLYFYGKVETKRDNVIYRHLRLVNGEGHYWTVTDELLSLMEKDRTLVSRYPEFYQ